MFNRILVPTDGSARARRAAEHAIAIAKATGGRIVGLHVVPPLAFDAFTDYLRDFVVPADYAKNAKKVANRHLQAVRTMADAAGVRFDGRYVISHHPAPAIVSAAKKYRCDAIVMGSHARRGMKKVLLGSQTQEVLASAKVPVVVTH